jgi:hypothetical protein
MVAYDFGIQLARGESGEQVLDKFFSDKFGICPASRQQQLQGIDRIFKNRETGNVLKIEYKTDDIAHRSGNAFVETVSVDSVGKPGWAYTSRADYLIYYIPGDLLIYVIQFSVLREQLPSWINKYPVKKAPNKGYFTHGIPVPLAEFERCAETVIAC